jgi:NADP-dependent 3-hydroxy acid dehydrogenase YdfG
MADSPVLIITGASTGIGAATARDAVEAGYRVVLAARSADKLSDLASELGGDDKALAVTTDVTEWDDNEALVTKTLDAYGRIDAVFANAGFGAKRGYLEETPEFWKSMVLTNVLGVAYTIRATLPHLKERGTGHYVITSSIAGRRALPGSLYSATKHAVTAIGETLRQELRGDEATKRIRMTLIEPGMVDTPFFDNPVQNALQPEDVSRAVIYALQQPDHVDVNEILIRPTSQAN